MIITSGGTIPHKLPAPLSPVARALAEGGSRKEQAAKQSWREAAKKVAAGGALTPKQFEDLAEARTLLGRTAKLFDEHVAAFTTHALLVGRLAGEPTAAESDVEQKRLAARIAEIEADIDRQKKELIQVRFAHGRLGQMRGIYQGQLDNLLSDHRELFADGD